MSVHIATGAHVPSDHSPIRKRIRILLQRLGGENYSGEKKRGEEIRKYAMLPHTFAQGFIIQMTSKVCTGSISPGESVKRAEYKRKKSTITFFFFLFLLFFFKGFKGNKRTRSYRVSETNGN
jgi:hypothetical protein